MSNYSIYLLYGVLHFSYNGYGGTHHEMEQWSQIKGFHLFYSGRYSQRQKSDYQECYTYWKAFSIMEDYQWFPGLRQTEGQINHEKT